MKKKLLISILIVVILAVAFVIIKVRSVESISWDYTGYLEWETTRLSFERPGKIIKVLKDEGEMVEKGDTIAVIDTTDVNLRINSLKAQLESLVQERKALESNLDYLLKLKRSLEKLEDKGVARDKIRKIDSEINSLNNKIKSISKQREALEENLKLLEEEKRKCFLVSTLNGTVISLNFKKGELYSPQLPFVEIGKIDTLLLYFFVPYNELHKIHIGDSVKVFYNGKVYKAKVVYISEEAEFTPKLVETREEWNKLVFRVKAKIPNEREELKAGLPVDVARYSP